MQRWLSFGIWHIFDAKTFIMGLTLRYTNNLQELNKSFFYLPNNCIKLRRHFQSWENEINQSDFEICVLSKIRLVFALHKGWLQSKIQFSIPLFLIQTKFWLNLPFFQSWEQINYFFCIQWSIWTESCYIDRHQRHS